MASPSPTPTPPAPVPTPVPTPTLTLRECPICKEQYDRCTHIPRTLPCFHTICSSCVETMVKSLATATTTADVPVPSTKEGAVTVVCPIDRREVKLTSGDVSSLSLNFVVSDVASPPAAVASEPMFMLCGICRSQKVASHWCEECEVFMCAAHSALHPDDQPDHYLVAVEDFLTPTTAAPATTTAATTIQSIVASRTGVPVASRTKGVATTTTKCPIHKSGELKFYCTNHNLPICVECCVVDHQECKRDHLMSVYTKEKDRIFGLVSEARSRVATMRQSMTEMVMVTMALKDKEKTIGDDIDKSFVRLHSLLEAREKKIKTDLSSLVMMRWKHLADWYQVLKSRTDSITRSCDEAERLMSSESDVARVLMMRADITCGLGAATTSVASSSSSSVTSVSSVAGTSPLAFTRESMVDPIRFTMESKVTELLADEFAMVDDCSTIASQCTMEDVMSTTVMGRENKFVLVARDWRDVKRGQGGDRFTLHIAPTAAPPPIAPTSAAMVSNHKHHKDRSELKEHKEEKEGKASDGAGVTSVANVVDRGDGSYLVSYKINQTGSFSLSVMLNDRHVKGSPFAVEVRSNTPTFLRKWGVKGAGAGEFDRPVNVAIAPPTGWVYVVDQGNHRIQVFQPDGIFIRQWGRKGSGDGEFDRPYSVAVSPLGGVYVADHGNNRVQMFLPDGSFVRKWGSIGLFDGQFRRPTSVSIGQSSAAAVDGLVYVSDMTNRIQVFRLDGTFVRKFGSTGSGDGQFSNPLVTCSADGLSHLVYVADCENDRIQVFQPDGTFVRKWGTPGGGIRQMHVSTSPDGLIYPSMSDASKGELNRPTCVATSPDGLIYVSNTGDRSIQVYRPDGTFVRRICGRDSADDRFNCPLGIACSPDGIVYVADYGNHCIQTLS